jgi:uncharacterized protein YyaL (SSP411 family)
VVAASALLRAYAVTDRLPYAMLAEELMTYAVRGWWDESRGAFAGDAVDPATSDRPGSRHLSEFAINCHAARVLGHLAALHRDEDYRTMAAVGQQVDYGDRASRTLSHLDTVYQQFGVDSAPYGLAIEEWLKRT